MIGKDALKKISPRWAGRNGNGALRDRLGQFRGVIEAAQAIEGYCERLQTAGLDTRARVEAVRDVELAVLSIPPISRSKYNQLFSRRRPAWRRSPWSEETRSAFLAPYAEARSGMQACHDQSRSHADLYSAQGIAAATADIYRLGRALNSPGSFDWQADHAVVAFCGVEAGLVSEEQRERFWMQYGVPLFEQFVGPDGSVVASECEVHAGLHIRPAHAVLECLDGELVITSLTDKAFPALRLRSGLECEMDRETCDCGRTEPRIVGLRARTHPRAASAVA